MNRKRCLQTACDLTIHPPPPTSRSNTAPIISQYKSKLSLYILTLFMCNAHGMPYTNNQDQKLTSLSAYMADDRQSVRRKPCGGNADGNVKGILSPVHPHRIYKLYPINLSASQLTRINVSRQALSSFPVNLTESYLYHFHNQSCQLIR